MTQFEVIGIGRLGSALVYTMMLLEKDNKFHLREFFLPNKRRAFAEHYDLLPIARATGNHLLYYTNLPSDAYIITAGIPRSNTEQKKKDLLKYNRPILNSFMHTLPKDKPIFIATNPPNELAEFYGRQGFNAIPLRKCTDDMRGSEAVNDFVLKHKRFTQWTPAFACAREILGRCNGKRL